ncbi:MAG TPA: carboxypeptidase-like regulatory domain-containing protein [Gaiellaceae bacterium]
MRTLLAATAVVLAASAPAGAAPTGLRGVVTRGPISPVCSVERPCSAPAKGVTLTFSRRHHSWTATTDTAGRYRIVLRPGTYTVTMASQPLARAWTVVVPAGRFAVKNFSVDTGIR